MYINIDETCEFSNFNQFHEAREKQTKNLYSYSLESRIILNSSSSHLVKLGSFQRERENRHDGL